MSVVGEAAKLAGDAVRFAAGWAADWCYHHPHDKLIHVCKGKVDLIVQEVAQSGVFKDEIRLKVIVSPANKLNGVVVDAKGNHSWKARAACEEKLSEMAANIYHIK